MRASPTREGMTRMQDAARRIENRAAELSYPARLLERPEVTAEGVCHDQGGERILLAWSAVHWAIAAEVGEPEGIRTIVFDLLTRDADGEFRLLRLDADLGGDAMELARELARGLGPERKSASIRCLATDGIPARCYPDLDSFEQEALAELRAAL